MLEFPLILALLGAYFAPSLIALWRRRSKASQIFAVNLSLGWTLIGWCIALAWALGIGGKKKRRRSDSFDPYGGMAVTTAERFNTRFITGCFGLVAAAVLISQGLHLVGNRHSQPTGLTEAESAHVMSDANQSGTTGNSAASSSQASQPAAHSSRPVLATRPAPALQGTANAATLPAALQTKTRSSHEHGDRHRHLASATATQYYVDGIPQSHRRHHHRR